MMPAERVKDLAVMFKARDYVGCEGFAWAHFDLNLVVKIDEQLRVDATLPIQFQRMDQYGLIHMMRSVNDWKLEHQPGPLIDDYSSHERQAALLPQGHILLSGLQRNSLQLPDLVKSCYHCAGVQASQHWSRGPLDGAEAICNGCDGQEIPEPDMQTIESPSAAADQRSAGVGRPPKRLAVVSEAEPRAKRRERTFGKKKSTPDEIRTAITQSLLLPLKKRAGLNLDVFDIHGYIRVQGQCDLDRLPVERAHMLLRGRHLQRYDAERAERANKNDEPDSAWTTVSKGRLLSFRVRAKLHPEAFTSTGEVRHSHRHHLDRLPIQEALYLIREKRRQPYTTERAARGVPDGGLIQQDAEVDEAAGSDDDDELSDHDELDELQ